MEIRAGLCGTDPDSRDGALHRHSQTRIAGGNASVFAGIWRVCEVESDGSVAADEGGGEFGRTVGRRAGVPGLRDLVARDGASFVGRTAAGGRNVEFAESDSHVGAR